MSKRDLHLKIGELKADIALLRNLEISVGRIYEEDWAEPLGPTPFPTSTQLRSWDMRLLERYKPLYTPLCDLCCLCTMGKCDLTGGKRGACGLDISAQQSRMVLLTCCIGAATHTGHARHLIDYLIRKNGREWPIDVGGTSVDVEAPITRLVCGIRPKKLKDLEDAVGYLESEITNLLSVTHTGQEGNALDFESKIFHAGMIDHVGMEIADLAQISALDFPRADPAAPLADIGFGTVDKSKPVILVVGHNVPSSIGIIDYLEAQGLADKVEVCGICCTAHDLTRYNSHAKIVGPMSWQLRFTRSGIADVIVVDEQCIRADTLIEAQKTRTPVIASVERNCLGLDDRTQDQTDNIVQDLVNNDVSGALILDPSKVGEVAVRTALGCFPKRRKLGVLPSPHEISKNAEKCVSCDACRRACPNDLPISPAITAAGKGNPKLLAALYSSCIGCGRCESACPNRIAIHSLIIGASHSQLAEERSKIRTGRGAIQDVEIRNVGSSIVLGEIPGVIGLVGCPNYPDGGNTVAEIAEEFANRRYIVTTSGCSAMSIAMKKNEEGLSPYESHSGAFEAGGIINVGSCVATGHIAGTAIKIASIFAKRPLRGNYAEIADYVLNRVGAVGVAWGAFSQKAASIASGFWRLGIPVVVGPHGLKYRRMLLGRKDQPEDWFVHDARTGGQVYVGPVPEHLFTMAETKEEAMVLIAKLCMRANDTSKGRAIKLTHYIDLHRRFYGKLPEDFHLFVRNTSDIPITMKPELQEALSRTEWKENVIPDPTLLPKTVRTRDPSI